jgi:hypothetical protein
MGSFPHSSLQILSSSVRLDGDRFCTAIFRSLQRCLIRFKSRPWLGHSRTFRDLSRGNSCVILAVCLGSLSWWKVNLRPSLRSWALSSRFLSRISLYFAPFIFPSILTSLAVSATEKHPHRTWKKSKGGLNTFRRHCISWCKRHLSDWFLSERTDPLWRPWGWYSPSHLTCN